MRGILNGDLLLDGVANWAGVGSGVGLITGGKCRLDEYSVSGGNIRKLTRMEGKVSNVDQDGG